jgi:predicted enzyme related to lactoylglutathione lyase
MKVSYDLTVVRLFVHDFEGAVRFYQDTLGMTLETRADELGWAQFATGACALALERLARGDPEAPALVGRYAGVSLRVSDVQATYRVLVERGVQFLAPPEKQAWGGTLAHLRDPEGNVLTLLG